MTRSLAPWRLPAPLVISYKVNDRGEHSTDDHPEKLVPIEERYADPHGFFSIVERWPENSDELDEKEQVHTT